MPDCLHPVAVHKYNVYVCAQECQIHQLHSGTRTFGTGGKRKGRPTTYHATVTVRIRFTNCLKYESSVVVVRRKPVRAATLPTSASHTNLGVEKMICVCVRVCVCGSVCVLSII